MKATPTEPTAPLTDSTEAIPEAPDADLPWETAEVTSTEGPRDDLPPDFWDDLPEAVPAEEASAKPATRETPFASPISSGSAGGFTNDPRFATLQSLFPGEIVSWTDESDATEPDNENALDLEDWDEPE